MSFGQASGPPAPANKVRELLALLQEAGHTDFRDARGPMGFTQRQAGGKFTRDEVDAFIERLEAEVDGSGDDVADEPPPRASAPIARSPRPTTGGASLPGASRDGVSRDGVSLDGVSSAALAAELQRRGWIVAEP